MTTPSAPPIEIRLLGRFEVRRGGEPVELPPSRKARALLAYLVATGRPHSRSALCDMLWDDVGDPRGELRWALSRIRRVVDDEEAKRLATSGGDRVVFEPHGADIDLAAVRGAEAAVHGRGADDALADADLDALRAAADRFRGEFLDGLDLADRYAFDAWLTGERERLRRLRIALLATIGDRLADRPDDALPYVFGRLALDPYAESAHAAAIRLLARLGRAREALEQYERCRRMLRREFGARPSPELDAARRAIGAAPPDDAAARSVPPVHSGAPGWPAPARSTVASGPPGPPAPEPRPTRLDPPPSPPSLDAGAAPPLVGRDAERAAIGEAVGAAAAGSLREVLFVLGEPGIGKTRLLQELAGAVLAADGRVLAGRGFEAESVRPYGPWADALRGVSPDEVPEAPRAALSALLPGLGAPAGSPVERAEIFDAVAGLVGSLADRGGPVAVVLDDVHWLDESSVALLHYLARVFDGGRVVLALAARDGELADNVAVSGLARVLRRAGRLRALTPGRLDADGTAALVHAVDDRVDAGRVFDESEGNPLFALELARALSAGDTGEPATLERALDDRLARLDDRARDLLPWAAALGRSFSPELLERVAGTPSADLLAGLRDLERRRIVRPQAGGDYDFAHDLLRRAAYRQLSEPARRLTHLEIARALDALADDALAADVARHAALGGDAELAARASAAAGHRCLRLFAYDEAVALASAGLEHAGGLPPDKRLPLELDLYDLLVHPGVSGTRRPADLESELRLRVDQARHAGLASHASAALHLIGRLHFQRGELERAHDATLRAERAGRSADPAAAARALADTARCLGLLDRDLDRARTLAREAARLARDNGVERVEIPFALGLTRHHFGDLDAADDGFRAALALARRTGEPWSTAQCLTRLAMLDLERGRPRRALDHVAELADGAGRLTDGVDAAFAAALDALARRALAPEHADPERAASNHPGSTHAGSTHAGDPLDRALDRLRAVDSKWMIAYTLATAAEQDLDAGRAADARRRAELALDAATAVDRPSLVALAHALLARSADAIGQPRAAAEHLAAARTDLDPPHRVSARARAAISVAVEINA